MKYGNAVRKERAENGLEGVQAPPMAETALKALKKVLEPKNVAEALGVGERTVQKWKSGESPIPSGREEGVLRQAKSVFLADLNRLEDEIDRALLMQYGPVDRGRF